MSHAAAPSLEPIRRLLYLAITPGVPLAAALISFPASPCHSLGDARMRRLRRGSSYVQYKHVFRSLGQEVSVSGRVSHHEVSYTTPGPVLARRQCRLNMLSLLIASTYVTPCMDCNRLYYRITELYLHTHLLSLVYCVHHARFASRTYLVTSGRCNVIWLGLLVPSVPNSFSQCRARHGLACLVFSRPFSRPFL